MTPIGVQRRGLMAWLALACRFGGLGGRFALTSSPLHSAPASQIQAAPAHSSDQIGQSWVQILVRSHSPRFGTLKSSDRKSPGSTPCICSRRGSQLHSRSTVA